MKFVCFVRLEKSVETKVGRVHFGSNVRRTLDAFQSLARRLGSSQKCVERKGGKKQRRKSFRGGWSTGEVKTWSQTGSYSKQTETGRALQAAAR